MTVFQHTNKTTISQLLMSNDKVTCVYRLAKQILVANNELSLPVLLFRIQDDYLHIYLLIQCPEYYLFVAGATLMQEVQAV